MSNQTLFFFTALVILAMLILLGLNLTSLLTGQPSNQVYLKYNDVRGMAVSRGQKLYTLNFQQQNSIIDILNNAQHITEIKSGKRLVPNIDKLIVYLFEDKPDIVITPIAYVDQDLVFSAPTWVSEGYLMELSTGNLKKLLAQTYD